MVARVNHVPSLPTATTPPHSRLRTTGRVVVVVGPTAGGKSALALRLAEAMGGEIVNCDALQVRAGLPLLTAKPTAADQSRVPHHLYGTLPPSPAASAAQYAALADQTMQILADRRCPAILCGGTGLYLRALLDGLFEGPPKNPALRARLRAQVESEGLPALHARLAAVDPQAAARIAPADYVRIERALEIYEGSGKPQSHWFAEHAAQRALGPRYSTLGIALDPGVDEVRTRIGQRVDQMLAQGLLSEVAAQRATGILPDAPLGYDLVCQHLDGALPLADLRTQLAQQTAQYARRQRTWFRRDPSLTWYRDADQVPIADIAAAVRATL